jgi:hypothetical protein
MDVSTRPRRKTNRVACTRLRNSNRTRKARWLLILASARVPSERSRYVSLYAQLQTPGEENMKPELTLASVSSLPIQLNRELDHINVVALREVILEDKSIYMVFEYAEHDFLVSLPGGTFGSVLISFLANYPSLLNNSSSSSSPFSPEVVHSSATQWTRVPSHMSHPAS